MPRPKNHWERPTEHGATHETHENARWPAPARSLQADADKEQDRRNPTHHHARLERAPFRILAQWARNTLLDAPIVELHDSSAATALGTGHQIATFRYTTAFLCHHHAVA